MKTKKIANKIIVRIDRGEELVESLKSICKEYEIKVATIAGVGATNKVTVGLFDVDAREYHSTELTGNYEITALLGNITTMKGETYLHLHISLGDAQYNSFGGHLNSATISATFEGVIEIIDTEVDRYFDEVVGLNLLKL
jgi:uncharacterized protein